MIPGVPARAKENDLGYVTAFFFQDQFFFLMYQVKIVVLLEKENTDNQPGILIAGRSGEDWGMVI